MQPVPTVPEPRTSPGRRSASRLAWARSWGQVQYMRAGVAAGEDVAVDGGGHLQVEAAVAVAVGKLVEGDEVGAEGGGEVLPLAGPEADGHLGALEVAGAPVVHDGEAGDPVEGTVVVGQVATGLADDAGELQLVIQRLAAAGGEDGVVGPDDAGGVGEVEDRDLIPLRVHVEPAVASAGGDVLLEGVEVAEAGDGGQGESHLRGSRGGPVRARSPRRGP